MQNTAILAEKKKCLELLDCSTAKAHHRFIAKNFNSLDFMCTSKLYKSLYHNPQIPKL